MAVIIPNKLIFLASPRTGSVAVSEALSRYPGAIKTSGRHHATLLEIKTFPDHVLGCPKYQPKNEIVFTTVRNHWDALVSWWLNRGSGTFENWLYSDFRHTYFPRGNRLWALHEADVTLRYETLRQGLEQLLQKVDLKVPIKIPRTNMTRNKRPWREYYTDETFGYVYCKYYDEIKEYGYDGTKPK